MVSTDCCNWENLICPGIQQKTMNEFERKIRARLRKLLPEDKVYLKKNYEYEIFSKHSINQEEINLLFDMKKIERIYPNMAFENRIDAEIAVNKTKRIKVIFIFSPKIEDKILGKIGIVTAFKF